MEKIMTYSLLQKEYNYYSSLAMVYSARASVLKDVLNDLHAFGVTMAPLPEIVEAKLKGFNESKEKYTAQADRILAQIVEEQ
jgi:hypothetical protein